MKAGQRGSGLVCCTSSSIITIVSSLFLARNKDRNNIPISNRSSTGKAYSLLKTVVDMMRKMKRIKEDTSSPMAISKMSTGVG